MLIGTKERSFLILCLGDRKRTKDWEELWQKKGDLTWRHVIIINEVEFVDSSTSNVVIWLLILKMMRMITSIINDIQLIETSQGISWLRIKGEMRRGGEKEEWFDWDPSWDEISSWVVHHHWCLPSIMIIWHFYPTKRRRFSLKRIISSLLTINMIIMIIRR